MAIKAILVDDDTFACASLKTLINEYCPDLTVVGEANTLQEAEDLFKAQEPGVIFLDMKMGNEHGFELLKRVNLSNCKIIVASAFEEFAIKAFQFSAIDYLLKPVDIDLLKHAVNKVVQELEANNMNNKLEAIMSSIKGAEVVPSEKCTIAIPTVFGSNFINCSEITRCEADRNYTQIHLNNQKSFMSSKTLSDIQSLLPTTDFYRIHHSHLINLSYMSEFHKGKQAFVVMRDGAKVPISQNKKVGFTRRLNLK